MAKRKQWQLAELEADSRRLEEEFRRGDKLAPFELCSLWSNAELDFGTLPSWVIEHLAGIAASYFAQGIGDVTPRAFLDKTPKQRNRDTPDLNKIAGLAGIRGRQKAWAWRLEHARDPYIKAFIDYRVSKAKRRDLAAVERLAALPEIEYQVARKGEAKRLGINVSALDRLVAQRRKYVYFGSERIKVIDSRGRPTKAFQNAVAEDFRVAGYDGADWDKSRSVKRRLDRLKDK